MLWREASNPRRRGTPWKRNGTRASKSFCGTPLWINPSDRNAASSTCIYRCVCIYIYIYMYIHLYIPICI